MIDPRASLFGASHVANGPALEELYAPEEAPAVTDPNGYENASPRYPASGWLSGTPTTSYIVTVKSGASQAVLPGNIIDFTVLENRGATAAMRGFNLNPAGRSFAVAGAGIDAVVRVNLSGSHAVTAFTPLADLPPVDDTTTDDPADDDTEENVTENLTDEELETLEVDAGDDTTGFAPLDPFTPEPEPVGLSPMGKVAIGGAVLVGAFLAFKALRKRRRRRG